MPLKSRDASLKKCKVLTKLDQMYPQVNIDEEIIKVTTLVISGRRMTKIFFNQILIQFPFDGEINFTGDLIIGYVNDANLTWLLFISKKEIRKYSLRNISRFSRFIDSTSYTNFDELRSNIGLHVTPIFPQYDDEYGDSYSNQFAKNYYSDEVWSNILGLRDKAKSFLESLDGRQIFIG